ncbi:MAG: hypothetical protein AAFQ07_02755 [Chloroflexota bacterium]
MQPPDPNIKRKNTSPLRVIVNQWGCLLAIFMLGIGGAMGLLAAIFVAPQLLGFDLTATALYEEAIVLAATDADLDFREDELDTAGTAFALDQVATEVLLSNRASLIDQTETQSARNIIATSTAEAVESIERQTQIANDFDSTQAALNANATDIALDFRNTQAALGIEPTSAPPTSEAQAQTLPATITPLPRFTFDTRGVDINTEQWRISDTADWQTDSTGWIAQRDGVWALESTVRIADSVSASTNYTINVDVRPATGFAGDYWVLFAMDDTEGLAAYFYAEALTITQVGLFRFELAQLENGMLSRDDVTVLRLRDASTVLTEQTQFMVIVEGDQVRLRVQEDSLLTANLSTVSIGRLGVQLPEDATLRSIGVGMP